MKKLNLIEMLKGYEGETFYCSLYGDVTLLKANYDVIHFTYLNERGERCSDKVFKDGAYTNLSMINI